MRIPFSDISKEQDFRVFYEKYYAPFCLYAKRFVDNKETREDIVSDVFASLWNKLDTVDLHSDTALGYVKMSVKNSCLNYLKRLEHEWNYAEAMQKAPVYETQPDSVYTIDDLYQMLYEALERLPETHRKVFTESFFNGKMQAEIAQDMGVSVKTIIRYKQKTLELLRNELKDYLPLIIFLIINNRSTLI